MMNQMHALDSGCWSWGACAHAVTNPCIWFIYALNALHVVSWHDERGGWNKMTLMWAWTMGKTKKDSGERLYPKG